MRRILILLCGLGILSGQPTPVESVDLSRYVGTWYEIARLPNRFQEKCVRNTTATYALRDDGRISVVNGCMTATGEEIDASGLARIVDTASNAKLKVSFFNIFGWHLFWGDYWIIGLDPEYRFAVVGTPSR